MLEQVDREQNQPELAHENISDATESLSELKISEVRGCN